MARQRIDLEEQTNWPDYPAAGVPTKLNKEMAALATTSDGDLACNTAVAATPAADSYVTVRINGQPASVGDGVKTAECYFSADGGTTARAIADVATGDLLYWVGSVAGYQLEANWAVDFDYDEPVGKTGGGGSLGLVTEGVLELWVRAVDGDDGNSGETEDEPLATLIAAEAKIPLFELHPVIIHLGAHTGNGYVWPTFRRRVKRDHIIIIGDGAGVGDGFTEVVSSTAALAGSGKKLVVGTGFDDGSRGGYGEHFGSTIEVLTGGSAGDRRTVRRNTATGLIPVCGFTSPVSAGDTYRIVRPAIKVQFPDYMTQDVISYGNSSDNYFPTDLLGPNSSTKAAVVLVNVAVHASGVQSFVWNGGDDLILLGVEFQGGVSFIGDGTVQSGFETFYVDQWTAKANEGVPLGSRLFSAPSNMSWLGWCVSQVVTAFDTFYLIGERLAVSGYFACSQLVASSNLVLAGGAFWSGADIREHNFAPSTISIGSYYEPVEIGHPNLTSPAIRCNNGFAELVGGTTYGGKVTLYAKNDGIVCNRSGMLQIFAWEVGAVEINVSSATSPCGIRVHNRSDVCVANQLPTISAYGNDFSVNGGRTYHSISELVENAHYNDLLFGSIYRTGDL